MKKRVLLPPVMRSPKLEAIKAAVEEVAAEREKRIGKKKVRRYRREILEPAVRLRDVRRSKPPSRRSLQGGRLLAGMRKSRLPVWQDE